MLTLPESPLGRALQTLFAALAARLQLSRPLTVWLAGGMAVYLYVGKRVTHDVDAEFGARILLPADLAVLSDDGAVLHFDPNYNPMFALLHEDYRQDAIPVALQVPDIDLRVLAPVDLAVSKIARLGDVDAEDIASLVRAGLTDADAIRERAEAALTGYIGNPADIRQRIDTAVALARAAA